MQRQLHGRMKTLSCASTLNHFEDYSARTQIFFYHLTKIEKKAGNGEFWSERK